VTPRTELARAVRLVNRLFYEHPDPKPPVYGERWEQLEAELDAAFAAGNDAEARAAVERWERHARYMLRSPMP
jgi:hypothetical protein